MKASSGFRGSGHDYTEEGSSGYLQNVGKYVQNYTVSHPTVEYILVIHGRKHLTCHVNICYLNSTYVCSSESRKLKKKKFTPFIYSTFAKQRHNYKFYTVKISHYRLRLPELLDIRHMKVARLSALSTPPPRLYLPQEISFVNRCK